MLPLIAEVMDPKFWFAKRSINFLNMAHNFYCQNVQQIRNMGCFGTYSIMGGIEKYDMNVKHKVKDCNDRIISQNEKLVRVCVQTKEVVEMRNRCISRAKFWSECYILTFLCTG